MTGKLPAFLPRVITMLLIAAMLAWFANPSASIGAPASSNQGIVGQSCAEAEVCPEHRALVWVASGPTIWKFVRSKGPADTGDIVSITKIADILKSDPDFAGLMVRCVSHGHVDVMVILISPFPPQTRPQVTVSAGQTSKTFEGKMAAAGAAVVLPDEVAALASGHWQALADITISVKEKDTEIKGVVALDGLRPAYNNLIGACAQ